MQKFDKRVGKKFRSIDSIFQNAIGTCLGVTEKGNPVIEFQHGVEYGMPWTQYEEHIAGTVIVLVTQNEETGVINHITNPINDASLGDEYYGGIVIARKLIAWQEGDIM